MYGSGGLRYAFFAIKTAAAVTVHTAAAIQTAAAVETPVAVFTVAAVQTNQQSEWLRLPRQP